MSRDYQGRDLRRGYSFKDNSLKDADFSKADLRGVDFTNADLTGAKFKTAKINGTNFYEANLTGVILDEAVCGLKAWWTIFILIMSLFIMSLSGFSASIIISCNFYYFTGVQRGTIKTISNIFISVVYITFFQAYFLRNTFNIQQSYLIYIGICIILIVGVFIPFIEIMDKSKSENMQIFLTIIVFSITVVVLNLYLFYVIQNDMVRRAVGAFFGSLLGIIISHQAIIKKEKKYVWIWNLFVYIISVQGTKFHRSNLDNASFFEADIKGSSFIECTLMRTNWKGVKKIDCSRIQGNYLDNSKIRYLLIQKQVGKDKDYQDMSLQGLNLVNANLNKVDLSRADLSNSQLIKAELKDSILSQTRLDNVDLRGANITGATIEIRSIPATAKLNGLICEFFYPPSNLKQRYPNTEKLTSEEAIKILQKPSQINIIFEQDGIDWQAFLQTFKKCLQEFNISTENSEKLIQAFETKLNGDFVIRLNVPDNVDKVAFEHKLIQAYKKSIENLKRQYRNILKTTDIDFQENTSMLKITEQLANPGSIIIHNHNYNIVTTETETNSMSQPNNFTNNVQNSQVDRSIFNANEVITGHIGDNIFTPQQRQQNLVEAAAEIQQLLQQLEQTNPTTTTSGKITVVAKAVNEIENNPTLKERIIGALKSGGTEALKEAINHPLVNILMESIEGWKDAK